MLMKDRRYFQIANRIKNLLMDSEKDIDVLIDSGTELIKPLENHEVSVSVSDLLLPENYWKKRTF